MKNLLKYLNLIIKKYSNYIKIAISVVILCLIFQKIDFGTSISMIKQVNIKIILILLLISVVKFFTQAINWKFCLKITENDNVSFKQVIKTHLIGLALRFFMPGGHATFGKMFYFGENNRKSTFFSVLIEKFFMSWIIVFAASLALLSYFNKWHYLLGAIALLIALVPILLPLFFRKLVKFEILENYYSSLSLIILIQMGFILLTLMQYHLLLEAILGYDIPFIKLSTYIALILTANLIPITYSGLGLRETASALLLPQMGISAEVAVGTSLIIFIFNAVIPALPGIYYLIRKTN